jgi:transposase-like protein
LTPKKHEFEHDVKPDVEPRVRRSVKAVLQEVLEEEISEHLQAGYRELTPTRRAEHNGHFTRNLLTSAGKIERGRGRAFAGDQVRKEVILVHHRIHETLEIPVFT